MPTPNRRNFVRKKTRTEFKANKHLADPEVRNKELNNIYSTVWLHGEPHLYIAGFGAALPATDARRLTNGD